MIACLGHQTLLPGKFLKQLRQKAGVQVGSLNVHAWVVCGLWGLPAGKGSKQMKTFFSGRGEEKARQIYAVACGWLLSVLADEMGEKEESGPSALSVVGCPPSDLPSFSFIVLQT